MAASQPPDLNQDQKPLQVATAEVIQRDLTQMHASEKNQTETKSAEQISDEYVEKLFSYDPNNVSEKETGKSSVETMASDVQTEAARMSAMLKEPIGTISKRGANDGEVGNALIQLKMKVEELDPAKFNFEAGWFSRLVGKVPGVGDPLKRYFTKYESAQSVIQAIMGSLQKGRDQLQRDNQTMLDDQKEMWTTANKLQNSIAVAQLVDKKLTAKTATLGDAEKKQFIENELLFSLRQRTIDLQQQLAVTQQGIMAMELIVRNNKELVRGVNRALNVTMSALQVGVTVAVALERQKDVLDKVTAVSSTTSDLIAGTAARLKTQGVAIQKQASSATLSMDSLKSAFTDLNTALDDISKFRSAALPQMAQTVLELDRVTGDAAKSLGAMDRGNKIQGTLQETD